MTNSIPSSSSDNSIQLLHAYMDGELDLTAALGIEGKIAADPKLAAERDRIIALREAIQQNLPREPIPPALQLRIEKAIGLRQETSTPTWRTLAASVALAVLVTSSSTWLLLELERYTNGGGRHCRWSHPGTDGSATSRRCVY